MSLKLTSMNDFVHLGSRLPYGENSTVNCDIMDPVVDWGPNDTSLNPAQ